MVLLLTVLASVCMAVFSATIRKCQQKKKLALWILADVLISVSVLIFVFSSFTAFLDFSFIKLIVGVSAVLLIEAVRLLWFWKAQLPITKAAVASLAIALLSALFFECVIANFRSVQSQEYHPIDVTENVRLFGDEAYIGKGTYEVKNGASQVLIEIPSIHAPCENLYLGIFVFDTSVDNKPMAIKAAIRYSDDANAIPRWMGTRDFHSNVEASRYMKLQAGGDIHELSVTLEGRVSHVIVDSIVLNARRPFDFQPIRFLAVAAIVFLAIVLRPGSRGYQVAYRTSGKQKLCTLIVFFLLSYLLLGFCAVDSGVSAHHLQYQQLAQSFEQGKLWLPQDPPQALIEMENPYDTALRSQVMAENNATYYWDAAYYQGHYYMYFGVVPVLTMFLPYRWITGNDFQNSTCVLIYCLLAAAGIMLLFGRIIKQFMSERKVPYVAYLVVCTSCILGGGLLFLAQVNNLYAIPIVSGLAYTVWGWWAWLKAISYDKISWKGMAFGSLCMALVAGCRPQLLLGSFVAIPLLWQKAVVERELFSRKNIAATIAFVLPYLVIAAGLMWYNFARFGSPFDFGANYNLTTNDMTKRGFNPERIGLAFYTYFLQMPKFISVFPFIRTADIDTLYIGNTTYEAVFGGLFTTNLFVWGLAFWKRTVKSLKQSKLFAPLVISSVSAIIIALFDAQAAGLLFRYFSDFSLFLYIPAGVVLLFAITENQSSPGVLTARNRSAIKLMVLGFFAVLIFRFMMAFVTPGLEYYNDAERFIHIQNIVQFWN